MKRHGLSYLWMLAIVVVELFLIFGLFLFSTRFQVLFVILSSFLFFGLLFFLLLRRIKERANLIPKKEVVRSYLMIFRNVLILMTGATFFLAFVKGIFLLIGRF